MNDGYGLEDTAFLLCRGGWPLSIQPDKDVALEVTSNYYESLFNLANSENPNFRNKNPEIMKIVMRAYAVMYPRRPPPPRYWLILQHVTAGRSATRLLRNMPMYLQNCSSSRIWRLGIQILGQKQWYVPLPRIILWIHP